MGKPKKEMTKNVAFDHLQVQYTSFRDDSGNAGMRVYKLEALLQEICKGNLPKTRKVVNGDPYMFHVCKYHADSGLWELQILHFREKILPGIADDFGGYEQIKLKDTEYPAESATLIYDQKTRILYMQRNKFALSIRNLEAYLGTLSPDGTLIQMAIVNQGKNIKKVTSESRYRNVVFTVDTRNENQLNEDSDLKQIIEAFKKYQGAYISVTIRTSRKIGSVLNGSQVKNLIRDAYDYQGTSKLETDMADPDDLEFETIDMLDNRSQFIIEFSYSRQHLITHDRLFAACKAEIEKTKKENDS